MRASATASRAVSAAISASFSGWLRWVGTGNRGTQPVELLARDRVKNFLTGVANQVARRGLILSRNGRNYPR